MIRFIRRYYLLRQTRGLKDIDPDEIFIDSSNLPNFDTHQFEGRIEKSISRRTLFTLGVVMVLILFTFLGQVWSLQINNGEFNFVKSENNRLRHSLIFAKRGVVYDRTGKALVWNAENLEDQSFDYRKYLDWGGLAHVLGYVKYPSKDKFGFYYSEVLDGKAGVEQMYNTMLAGENGKRIIEVNALGEVQSENVIHNPTDGEDLKLTIDAELQSQMFQNIQNLANQVGFTGGAGVIMNIGTGEVLALTSYPEYKSQVLTDGKDTALINQYLTNKNNPFLDRAIDGLYTPGSTVKPFMAFAALNEGVIDPYKNIYSSGSLTLPNPYNPASPTIFRDWKAHGYTDMRRAIAVSSDVYFYEVGGGFEDQKGLGITKIDQYMKLFGFGQSLPSSFFSGPVGVIPTPAWKKEHFDNEDWTVGNTYHTSIGQYGFQASPIQLLRAVASLVNGGKLITPTLIADDQDKKRLSQTVNLHLNEDHLQVVREGMRDAVVEPYGSVHGLYSPTYSVAAKTGTAELGASKQFVNSWISGFWPYEQPKYAFVIIMERGPVTNTLGALYVMRQTMLWLAEQRPEYLR